MEKFFEVTKESKLYEDYINYKENIKNVNGVANAFLKENNFETTQYSAQNSCFYILPTENDIKNHKTLLCNPISNGLRKIKPNTKIGKAWVKRLDNEDLIVQRKPPIPFYFEEAVGQISSRIFQKDEKIYLSYKVEGSEITTPNGMIEIKGSEFYRMSENVD